MVIGLKKFQKYSDLIGSRISYFLETLRIRSDARYQKCRVFSDWIGFRISGILNFLDWIGFMIAHFAVIPSDRIGSDIIDFRSNPMCPKYPATVVKITLKKFSKLLF